MSRDTRTALAATLLLAACTGEPKPSAAAPAAALRNPVTEDQLTTVTLSEDAVRRLGIEVAPVERRAVARTRTLGGEVVVPPGRALTVSAPVAGTVLAERLPQAGERVVRGQPMMRLLALPPESDLLRAEQETRIAEAHLEQARAEEARYSQLLAQKAATQQEYERARAALLADEAELRSARARRARLRGETSTDEGALTPLIVTAPDGGIVRAVHAGAGQNVAAGAPLFEVLRLDRVWVRVPVYVGELGSIARGRAAAIHGLGEEPGACAGGGCGRMATPVAAPPSADAASSSADLYFELSNDGARLRPGERVSVALPLLGADVERTVVPWSAVLHDVSGGAWVYERTAPGTFVRRRVEIREVVGDFAVLERGPSPGVEVVTAGAAELFGTEFGAGK